MPPQTKQEELNERLFRSTWTFSPLRGPKSVTALTNSGLK